MLVTKRSGNSVMVRAEAKSATPRRMIVQLVHYSPSETVSIHRGELAGHQLTYHNVVQAWTKVADWDGATPLSFDTTASSDAPAVVIIQEGFSGPVIAAEKVN